MKRSQQLAAVAAAFACIGGLAAQADTRANEAERQRTERSLQQNRAEAERLLELRLRHDLGLIPATGVDASERTFRPATPATTEALDRMQLELREEEAATAVMRESFEKLRVTVDQALADAAAKNAAADGRQPLVAVPAAGRPVPTRASQMRQQIDAARPTAETSPEPLPLAVVDAPASPNASPAATVAATAPIPPTAGLPPLDPLQAQITGSNDHRRVAQALFKAGQALYDDADARRLAGDVEGARAVGERAVERLRRALEVLAPVLQQKEPPFEALFCQGRTLELLFRHSERHEGLSLAANARDWQKREQEVRAPWLQIAARDVAKSGAAGEVDVAGPWAKAAQAALEHFRWTNLHGDYDAKKQIEAITWPGAVGR